MKIDMHAIRQRYADAALSRMHMEQFKGTAYTDVGLLLRKCGRLSFEVLKLKKRVLQAENAVVEKQSNSQ